MTGRHWISTAVFLVSVAGLAAQESWWPRLADVVKDLGTDTAGLPENMLSRRVRSYATLVEHGEYGLAYYVDRGDGFLHAPLYVAFRERGATWRQKGLEDPAHPGQGFGSALRIHATADYLAIDTHSSPSAGNLLILRRRNLTLVGKPYGWLLTALPGNLLVFIRSMVHIAPAHPEEVAIFDPGTGSEAHVYPTTKGSELRKAFIDRLRPLYEEAQKRDPLNVYGWDPEWFDVSITAPEYNTATDILTLSVRFSGDRHPREIGPPQTEDLKVTCQPMREATRSCTEARR